MKDDLIEPISVKDRDPIRYEEAKIRLGKQMAELQLITATVEEEARQEYIQGREPIDPISSKERDSEAEIRAKKKAAQEDVLAEEAYVRGKVNAAYGKYNEQKMEQEYKEILESIPSIDKINVISAVQNYRDSIGGMYQQKSYDVQMPIVSQTMKEVELHETWRFDFERNTMVYFDGTTSYDVTNYVFRVTGLTVMLFHDKNLNYEVVDMDVTISSKINVKTHHISVTMKQLSGLAEFVENRYGYANHLPSFPKTKVNEMVRFLIAAQIDTDRTTYCYKQPGWWKNGNGFRYVFDGRDLGVGYVAETHTSFIKGTLWPAGKALELLLHLEQKVVVPLLAFTVLSLIATMLEHTETPLRFTLFLYGPTGTMKTAVAKAICCSMVDEKQKLAASFQDTAAAIEKMLGMWCDRVLISDDLFPAEGEMKREMSKNLEKLLRLVSEHISRKRCTVQMELNESQPASCGVVATGELISRNKSSNLRIFNIQFCENYFRNNTVAKEILTQLQKNEGIMNGLLLQVIEYVEGHQNGILQWYEKTVMDKRLFIVNQGHTEELRLATATAQLWTAWELLLNAVKEVAPTAVSGDMYNTGVQAILQALYETDDTAQNSDPVLMYLAGIVEAITINKLQIAPDKNVYAKAKESDKTFRYAGFREMITGEPYLLLLHTKVVEAVTEIYKMNNMLYKPDGNSINSSISEKFPDLVQKNEKNLYRITVGKSRERFLCLKEDLLYALVEKNIKHS